jgi:hypothetical protein
MCGLVKVYNEFQRNTLHALIVLGVVNVMNGKIPT